MKTIFHKLLIVSVASLVFWACKKDETRVIAQPGTAGALTASTTSPELSLANSANQAVMFNFSDAGFGYKSATKYTLQFDKKGGNFSSPIEVSVDTSKRKAYTVDALNTVALNAGIVPGNTDELQVRVKYDVGSGIAPVYSNVIKLAVTPYFVLINYEFPQALRVAGNYQGWSPGSAPKIVDKNASNGTGNYEGYIFFNDPNPEFKLVKGADWGAGDFGADASTLTNGGGNIKLTEGAGVYLLKANTAGMTWSATKINTWGIIGNATPGGWDGSTPMNFDAATGKWTITTDLSVGEMKFRANNGWDINLGDNNSATSPRDNKPEYGGDNIPVTVAGNYTITLDLSLAGNYSYSLRKN